jgi:aspartyl-tRNA(Asn)/glutamyl-tRNA(Gln) amidotransferase subunit C
MIEVTEKLTRQVAELSRLELTDAEIQLFTSQLGDILSYVDQLSEVNVGEGGTEVLPMTQPLELQTPLREDIARPFPLDDLGQPRVLQSAPQIQDGGYQVPPIL